MKRTPLKRRTRLKPKSDKRKKLDVKRRAFVEEQTTDRPLCEAGRVIGPYVHGLPSDSGRWWDECQRFTSDIHEPLTRARAPGEKTILSVENSVATCRICHGWIDDNPAAATHLGLLIPSGRLPL